MIISAELIDYTWNERDNYIGLGAHMDLTTLYSVYSPYSVHK